MILSKTRLYVTVSLAAFIFASSVMAEDKLVATVNGEKITESDVKFATDDLAGAIPASTDETKRKYVIDYLIDMKLVSRAAMLEKMAETDDFKHRMEYAKDRALMEQMLVRDAKKAVTPEAMLAFYAEQVKSVKAETEVRARHILVVTEDEAKKALARVKGGEDFAKLAAELSTDPGSGKEGGDLGYFTKQRMVPEFAEAAFATDVGQVSEIVKSQFGYHIIKVEDKRDKQPPVFDQLKVRIEDFLTQKAQQDMVVKLRQQAKIERVGEAKVEVPVEGKNK